MRNLGGFNVTDWVIQSLLTTAMGLIIAIIAYFLKTFKTQLDKNDEQLQSEVDALTVDLQKYKLEASDKFVQKDDFIRATAQTDRKLDRIYDELMKMNKGSTEAKQ